MMNQFSYQADDETLRQIAQLAEWWGLPTIRHNTPVIARCVERVFNAESAKRELAEFDKLQNSESDPLK
jgi:hypothetical protein